MIPPPANNPKDSSANGGRAESALAGGGMKNLYRMFIFLLLAGLPFSIACAAEFDHNHARYGEVLRKFVREGRVNYEALKEDRQALDAYLDELSAISEEDFKNGSQEQRLSFLINLYNAQTLALIIDHYPVKSIKKIGTLFKGPWDQPVARLWGKTMTLNGLEHDILRRQYQEPLIHFALVCAARGCPILHGEPYLAGRLESQLKDQARKFLSDKNKNRIDNTNKIIYLSPIFKWFEEDFVKKSGSVLSFIQPYFPEAPSDLSQYRIQYTEYDWSLNVDKK